MTLARAFDPRANGLNLIRLALATVVIFWHTFPLTGRTLTSEPVVQILSEGAVDGFFAISGFLITASWLRNPDISGYVTARLLRIMPAFWVCLLVTVVVIAPLGTLNTAGRLPPDYLDGAIEYVLGNWRFQPEHYGILGTPTGVPYPHAWNGSIWTLKWEVFCYFVVLVLGVMGLVHRRATMLAMFALSFTIVALTAAGHVENYYVLMWGRFGLMFFAGAIVYAFRDVIPVRRWLIGACVLVIAASTFLSSYLLVSALPIAYVLVATSTYLRSPRLQLRNDISYGTYIYAFPLQQLLAGTALVDAPYVVFAVTATLLTWLVATGSWFWVEKPANRWRKRPMLEHAASHAARPSRRH